MLQTYEDHAMSARPTAFLTLLLLSPLAIAAPFCAVTGTGTNCAYYDVQSCRQAAGSRGACVVNPNEVQPDSTPRRGSIQYGDRGRAIETFNASQRALEESRQREQEEFAARYQREQAARQRTDPRLLPLSPDGGISPETQSVIMSTLFAALDMNAPGTLREWSNPRTGASGAVQPQDIVKNLFGESCRAFTISLSARGQIRSTSGNACRKDGQWVWQAG